MTDVASSTRRNIVNICKQRLQEVQQALQTQKLLEGDLPAIERKFKKFSTLLEFTREAHTLQIVVFPDGAVLVCLKTDYEEATYIILLAKPKSASWRVQVAPNFADRCSKSLFELWDRMPDRKNVDKGTFTKPNGLLALSRMVEIFAALPPSAPQQTNENSPEAP